MSSPDEKVAELRERVEEGEREFEAAVRDLKEATKRSVVTPSEWFRERPIPFLVGALAIGWWLGARDTAPRRRRRR